MYSHNILMMMLSTVCIGVFLLYVCYAETIITTPEGDDTPHRHLCARTTDVRGTDITPIYVLDHFLTDKECDQIIESTQDTFAPSRLLRKSTDVSFRTSWTSFSTVPARIEDKIAKFMNISVQHSETSQVQWYREGQEFKAHHDYFHEIDHMDYQRSWTFMIYLNEVDEGGETHFPLLSQTISPKKGCAVVWCNIGQDGEVDHDTLHQGMPIKRGNKYIITKWFKSHSH
jgi:prolyl 4-hydroxylase